MIWIPGPAGKLEGLLGEPEVDGRTHVAVFCHPHPKYGGTMNNKIVYLAARAARDLGVPVVRFNFRGTGRSDGHFDAGPGETEDLRAVVEYLHSLFPGRALIAGGVSFGAWVAGMVGGTDPRVTALVSIATPIALYDARYLKGVTKPVLFVQSTDDPYGPVDQLAEAVEKSGVPGRLVRIADAGHLFTGHGEEVYVAVRDFLRQVIGGAPADDADRRQA